MIKHLTKETSKELLIQLSKRYNELEYGTKGFSTIYIDEIRRTNTANRLASKLWNVLYPACKEFDYNILHWRTLRKENKTKYDKEIKALQEKKI